MALKLDELLLTKKKEPVQILDLSKSTASSKEELKKLLEKVPEFKIKMEKVRPEDVKIRDKRFAFHASKKELKPKSFSFANPIPSEMKSLRLDDLCSIGIQWRMLTSLRPKNKLDEEYFSKLIELGKLHASAREKEKRMPLAAFARKAKNRVGILETKFACCRECGEEFCATETCAIFSYDSYERISNVTTMAGTDLAVHADTFGDVQKRRKKRMKKRKSFKRRVSPTKRPPKRSQQRKAPGTAAKRSTGTDTTNRPKPPVVANKIRKTLPPLTKSSTVSRATKTNKVNRIPKRPVTGKKYEIVSKQRGTPKTTKAAESRRAKGNAVEP